VGTTLAFPTGEAVLQSRQRQASSEVRAAIALRQGQRTVAAARQTQVEFWRQQVAELEKRQAAGQAVTAELLSARLELLQAEAALLQAAADWHRADLQLRQALGLLVRE
jgi:outer membrane protein TolC